MGRRMLEHMVRHTAYQPEQFGIPDPDACRDAQALAPEAVITGSAEEAIAKADLVYLACPPAP